MGKEEQDLSDPGFYNGFPMHTPMDIRLGLTHETDINFELRWGIIGASAIASDWIKSLQDVPGARVTAVGARDIQRARAYAQAHDIPAAYDSYEAVCQDPNVDIIYVSTKTWDHADHSLMALTAGKHLVCEKPFADTANHAHKVYEAAEKADLFCQENMWTRCFPVIEHARAAIARGDIGKLQVVQSDYPDAVYALNPALAGFGPEEMPVIAAAGRKPEAQLHADNVYSAHGPKPSGAILQYTKQQGIAVITFAAGRFLEEAHFIGSTGRITIENPSHHPTALTIRTGWPPAEGDPAIPRTAGDLRSNQTKKPDTGFTGPWKESYRNQDRNFSHGSFNQVERFEYPVPTPAPVMQGQPPGSRWTGEKLIEYKGWNWGFGNQHGFMYQAQAIHRCIASGLKELPQFTRAESLRVSKIIDEINQQCAEQGFS
tara:strand:+ start:4227 stop:5516 length:1290 start_codon:yes stop_codon:yes gene_type:complete